MWIGIIKGTVQATIKHESMRKAALLVVQPLHPITSHPEGLAQVAVDTLGAGIGQRVLVSGDGAGAAAMLHADKSCPARLAIAAILDDNSIQSRIP